MVTQMDRFATPLRRALLVGAVFVLAGWLVTAVSHDGLDAGDMAWPLVGGAIAAVIAAWLAPERQQRGA
jgi:hypothetical protein